MTKTQFYRKVYEDAMTVFNDQVNEQEKPSDADLSKDRQPTTSEGQRNDGDGGSESIKTGPILSLTVETQDLIQLYNKLIKDKK